MLIGKLVVKTKHTVVPWLTIIVAIKKIAPALATGNSIVLKPSELAPVTVLELASLFAECGLPPGILFALKYS
jgi:acyl-CoA reductase-like NAD-dependent aldehyde dehydrogenase